MSNSHKPKDTSIPPASDALVNLIESSIEKNLFDSECCAVDIIDIIVNKASKKLFENYLILREAHLLTSDLMSNLYDQISIALTTPDYEELVIIILHYFNNIFNN